MKKIIFDIGVYDGIMSKEAINKGYKVIGVECNPLKLPEINNLLSEEIKSGAFTLIDKCVTDKSGESTNFFISKIDIWSSCNKGIAERFEESEKITVPTITINDIIEEYGVPYYLKCDIEGNDIVVLRCLNDTDYRPQYISCETECLGNNGFTPDEEFFILDELHNLGYKRFSLIKQIDNDTLILPEEISQWNDYEDTREMLSKLRAEHFSKPEFYFSFWYDVMASFE